MSETVYSRAPDVVWRLGPDRVLVRSSGLSRGGRSSDLIGLVAVVWLVLDEPGSYLELWQRLAGTEIMEHASEADVQRAIIELSDEGLVEPGAK